MTREPPRLGDPYRLYLLCSPVLHNLSMTSSSSGAQAGTIDVTHTWLTCCQPVTAVHVHMLHFRATSVVIIMVVTFTPQAVGYAPG
jgi:hypothetical protein